MTELSQLLLVMYGTASSLSTFRTHLKAYLFPVLSHDCIYAAREVTTFVILDTIMLILLIYLLAGCFIYKSKI